jgi:tetratricopeptide (TPR) repeat protein
LDYSHLLRNFYISATIGSITTNIPVELIQVLLQLGQITRAIEHVDLISEPHFKSKGYLLISQVFMEQEEEDRAKYYLGRAIDVLKSIGEESPSSISIFKEIALTASRLEDNEILIKLKKNAEDFEDHETKVRAFCEISVALFQSCLTQEAEDNILLALSLAREDNFGFDANELFELVQALVIIGLTADAKSAVWERLSAIHSLMTDTSNSEMDYQAFDDVLDSNALKSLTKSMGFLKDTEGLEEILGIVQTIEENSERIVAINDISHALINANEEDYAKDLTIQAFEDCVKGLDAAAIYQYPSEIFSLACIATNLKKIGMVLEARSLATQAIDGINQGEFFPNEIGANIHSASLALVLLEDQEGAMRLLDDVKQISDDDDKAQCLIWLTQALHDLNLEDKATQTAHQALLIAENIDYSDRQIFILGELSKVMRTIGFKKEAKEAISKAYSQAISIPETVEKSLWLSNVIMGLAELELSDKTKQAGEQILRLSKDTYEEPSSLSKVASAYMLIGLEKEAKETAQLSLTALGTMTDDYFKRDALIDVLDALGHVGMRVEAKELIEVALNFIQDCDDEWDRAMRTIAVTEALSKLEDAELLLSIKASTASFDDQIIKAVVLSNVALQLFKVGRQDDAEFIATQSLEIIKENTQYWVWIYLRAMVEIIHTLTQLEAEREIQQALKWFGEKIQLIDNDMYEKSEMIIRLSKLLIEANMKNEAAEITNLGLETARNITRERKKVERLSDWVSILAQLENLEEINKILDIVKNTGEQAWKPRVYSDIVQAYMDLSMSNEAKDVIELALHATERSMFIDDYPLALFFCYIAASLIAVDKSQFAVELTTKVIHALDGIEYPNRLATLIIEIAPILNALRDYDGIQEVYEIMQRGLATNDDSNKMYKVRCLCELALVLNHLQKEDESLWAISQVLSTTDSLESNFNKATALVIAAQAMFQMKQIEQTKELVLRSKKLVETITEEREKALALRELIPIWVKVDGSLVVNEIEKILATIKDSNNKAEVVSGYVQGLTALEDVEGLEKIHTNLLDNGYDCMNIDRMKIIAQSFYDVGMVIEAKHVTDRILKKSLEFTNERHRANGLKEAIWVMAHMQDSESLNEVKTLSESFRDRREKIKVLCEYARATSKMIGHVQALPIFIDALNESRLAGRVWLLEMFNLATPTLAATLGGETLFQICNSFQDVDSWW